MNVFRNRHWLLLLALLVPLQACGWLYSAKPIEGWVVDAATKQPLEGVNVVAHWVVNFGMEGGQGTDLMLMETVTDKNGRYAFPKWGPAKVPLNLPWEARMKNLAPELIFFKRDYWPSAVSNETLGPQPGPGPLVRTSDWNGKTIGLKKFEESLDRYGDVVSGVLTGVSWGSKCNWKQIPHMLVALDRESQRLWREKIYNALPTIHRVENAAEGEHCGSVKQFFSEYVK